jgi:hypothetical protein
VQMSVPAAPAQAQLGFTVNSPLTSGYRLAFDLYVDMTDLQSIPQVGIAQATPRGTGGLTVNYVLGPGPICQVQVFREPGGSQVGQKDLPVPPLRSWTRIVLVYDSVQGMSVIEDGTMLGTLPAASGAAPGSTDFIVGGAFSNPGSSGTVTPLVVDLDTVVLRGQ